MKAIFSPGPSFSDPEVRKHAGWVHIFDLYKKGLEELGYDVFIPSINEQVLDTTCTVSKILSYDLFAAQQMPDNADLFLGPPGYSVAQMMKLGNRVKKFLFVFNNADWWRDKQLEQEYKDQNAFYDMSQSWRWINKTALLKCDHVISCSPWVQWTHAEVVGKDKVSIAFWGVDSEKFHPGPEEPPGFNVLFVGGDPIRKGLKYLVEGLPFPLETHGIELWIAGGDFFYRVEGVRQFGMVPHDQMPGIMQQCHVICIPTLEDGIALAIQEGMACGLVPITSPETAEVFDDEVSGFKVGYRDAFDIHKRIIQLRDDSQLRRTMSQEARNKAVSQPWSMTKEQFKRIIQEKMELWGGYD